MISNVSVEDVLGGVTVVAFGLGVLWLAGRAVVKARASKLRSQSVGWLAAAAFGAAFALPVFALVGGPGTRLSDMAAQGFLVLVVVALVLLVAAWVLRMLERGGANRRAAELKLPRDRRLAPTWAVAMLGAVVGVFLTVLVWVLLFEVGVITDESGADWVMSLEIFWVSLGAVTGWWLQAARHRRYFHERGASRS